MSLDLAVFLFGGLVFFLVAAGILLAFYAPAFHETWRQMGPR